MRSFVDGQERSWELALNVTALKRLRGALNLDLMKALDDHGELLGRLASDPVLLCDALYVLCREQVGSRNMSEEQFGEMIAGETWERACNAFLEELVDFFRGRRAHPALVKLLAKMKQMEKAAATHAEKLLDDPGLTAAMEKALAGSASGSARESSELTPDRSASPS